MMLVVARCVVDRYDNLDKTEELTTVGSQWFGKPAEYAMNRYAYYKCFKCQVRCLRGTLDASRPVIAGTGHELQGGGWRNLCLCLCLCVRVLRADPGSVLWR